MFQLYEHYSTGDDTYLAPYHTNTWLAQIFTPSINHTVTYVRLKLGKLGSGSLPGTITVSVKDTDGDGKPAGADLCVGTFNGNFLLPIQSYGGWVIISLGIGTALTAETKYAIVLKSLEDNLQNRMAWYADTTSPTHDRGYYSDTSDGGLNWANSTSKDFMFEEYAGAPEGSDSDEESKIICCM